MTLRLDPSVPIVWRSPSELQFGVERVVARLGPLSAEHERMIAALETGITRGGLELLASGGSRAARGSVDALLVDLDPVLLGTDPATPRPGRIAVVGQGRLAASLAQALGAGDTGAPADLIVLVTAWVVSPADAGTWLRRDVPHLPVLVADGTVTVGPLVRPGTAPCLWCVHRTRVDEDPAWTAIASQLLDRAAPDLDPVSLAQATALAGRMAAAALQDPSTPVGTSFTIDTASGDVTARRWAPHADCRCAAPTGSDWESDAGPASPAPTS